MTRVIVGDCLTEMAKLPDASIDLCLTDPPYGVTANKWDTVIPFGPMWEQLNRLMRSKSPVVLLAAQPFSSALVMSNPRSFKYEWVWDKKNPSGYLIAKYRPLRRHESVLVFCKGASNYFPQMRTGRLRQKGTVGAMSENYRSDGVRAVSYNDQYYPTSILDFSNANRKEKVHPTQKPVDLLRYLIRTYSSEGSTVLDFTCGSGSTGVACVLEKRNFIGIELDEKYAEIARRRIQEATG